MNQSELDYHLQQHKLWLETDGNEGARANLQNADLMDADLRGANLHNADLMDADLRGANLRGANLYSVNLGHANLRYADLRGAHLDINIRDCLSFRYAKFTSGALPWLILHPKWTEWKDTVQISDS